MDFGSKWSFFGVGVCGGSALSYKTSWERPKCELGNIQNFLQCKVEIPGKFEHINHFIKKHWESFVLAVNFSCLQIVFSGWAAREDEEMTFSPALLLYCWFHTSSRMLLNMISVTISPAFIKTNKESPPHGLPPDPSETLTEKLIQANDRNYSTFCLPNQASTMQM